MEHKSSPSSGDRLRTDAAGEPVQNTILLSLPEAEFNLLRKHLEPMEMPQQTILQEAGEKIEFVYFLNGGMASLVVLTSDGRSVEVAIVGKEGILGTPLAMGVNQGPLRAIMQISGSGYKLKASILREAIHSTPEMCVIWNRYVLVQGLQMAQMAACNRLHEIEQRLARWLLMCQDRIESPTLKVTHEFMAQMLGTGRPSVSLAAGILQRNGLIENNRGTVTILNRRGLEDAACECYAAMQHFADGT